MNTTRACGCKSFRSCRLCEALLNLPVEALAGDVETLCVARFDAEGEPAPAAWAAAEARRGLDRAPRTCCHARARSLRANARQALLGMLSLPPEQLVDPARPKAGPPMRATYLSGARAEHRAGGPPESRLYARARAA